MQKVTVVIPVYGNWAAVSKCLSSVAEHCPTDLFDVLIVNDGGPEVDEIEKRILKYISGKANFTYARNSRNLGFVGSCNRAVFELDKSDNHVLLLNSDTITTPGAFQEMLAVLESNERHGAVCPRSNDATIASMPFFQSGPGAVNSINRTKTVFKSIAGQLPRFYVAPIAVGFCLLIRRDLIHSYGLFDEVYGKGYNEENDFCMRINQYGYSSVIANRALVLHSGSASFGATQRSELEIKNSATLLARYPYYLNAIGQFIQFSYSAIDRFSDLLIPKNQRRKPSILIDLHHMSLTMNGSTRNALTFLDFLESLPQTEKAHITVAAQPEAIDYFALHERTLNVIEYGNVSNLYDVGVSISPVTSVGQLELLNRVCARWVVSFLDAIALRTLYLGLPVPQQTECVRLTLQHADSVMAISQASIDDVNDLLFQGTLAHSRNLHVIHQGVANHLNDSNPLQKEKIDESGGKPVKVLLLGNKFKHKQVNLALSRILGSGLNANVTVIAPSSELVPGQTVTHINPGSLSDDELINLYRSTDVILFPSSYEGFGLPLVEAATVKKPIVALRSNTTSEVVEALGLTNVFVAQNLDELPGAIEQAHRNFKPHSAGRVKTMSEYNAELWKQVVKTSQNPLDAKKLAARDSAVIPFVRVAVPMQSDIQRLQTQMSNLVNRRGVAAVISAAAMLSPLRSQLARIKNKITAN